MKKVLAILLCAVTLLTVLPVLGASAEECLPLSEIIAMSNYMNSGQYVLTDNWFYGHGFNNLKATLTRYSRDFSSFDHLVMNTNADYIFIDDEWLYYLAFNTTSAYDGTASIRRIRLSGTEETIIVANKDVPGAGSLMQLFYYDNHIYFTKNDESAQWPSGALYRANMDGTEIVKILNKAVYYPYVIKDKLYYQDDNDSCRLHVCNLDGTEDSVFIDDFVFCYVTDGVNFFYEGAEGAPRWNADRAINSEIVIKKYSPKDGIVSLGLYDDAVGFAYDGYKIYYCNKNDKYRLYSYNLITDKIDLVSTDTPCTWISILSEGVLAYFDMTDDYKQTEHVYLIYFDGSNKRMIV